MKNNTYNDIFYKELCMKMIKILQKYKIIS